MFVYNVYTFCTDDPLNGQIGLSSHWSIWLWRLCSLFIDCRIYAGNQCIAFYQESSLIRYALKIIHQAQIMIKNGKLCKSYTMY